MCSRAALSFVALLAVSVPPSPCGALFGCWLSLSVPLPCSGALLPSRLRSAAAAAVFAVNFSPLSAAYCSDCLLTLIFTSWDHFWLFWLCRLWLRFVQFSFSVSKLAGFQGNIDLEQARPGQANWARGRDSNTNAAKTARCGIGNGSGCGAFSVCESTAAAINTSETRGNRQRQRRTQHRHTRIPRHPPPCTYRWREHQHERSPALAPTPSLAVFVAPRAFCRFARKSRATRNKSSKTVEVYRDASKNLSLRRRRRRSFVVVVVAFVVCREFRCAVYATV